MIGIFGASAGGSLLTFVLPFVAIIGMFWFMSRGQKKQQQSRQNMLDNISVGDQVVTIGGLHGEISEVNTAEKTVLIDCDGIFLEFDRSAIRTVTPGTKYDTTGATTTEIETSDEAEQETDSEN